jgi:hypothetical protein
LFFFVHYFSGYSQPALAAFTARKEPRWNYESDDNQIRPLQQGFVGLIQNITLRARGKADGCDAGRPLRRAENAPITKAALAWSLLLPETTRFRFNKGETAVMLWTIIVILLVLWLLGLIGHVGGAFIHLLLVIAVIVLIINLVTGRRAV